MDMPTHEEGMKTCIIMTSTAIHTITLGNGKSFAAIVHNEVKSPAGAAVVINRVEAEAMIVLLQNALDDADRLNSGQRPIARSDPGKLQ